jgi:hypothetical protein
MVLTILSKLGPEFSIFVSTFHTVRFASGVTWKMPSLEDFIESLTQEQTKLINMGAIKGPRAHALTVHDGSHKYQKSKDKDKRKSPCTYKEGRVHKTLHRCLRIQRRKGKKRREMHILSQRIPFGTYMHAKTNRSDDSYTSEKQPWRSHPRGCKEEEAKDLNSKKGNSSHALIAINSSPDAWIVDLGASHHLAASEVVYFSLDACKGPPILMGDNSFVEVTDKGRIELTNGSFENVLHVPKLSVNLLSMYQMTNSGTGKKVIFTPNVMDIYDMQTNSRVATGEVNHQSRLYTFSEFIEPNSSLLLTHADESSRIWHKRFGHLNFRYMQQLSKHILVDGLPDIHFSKGVREGCVLGKHPQEKFDKGKS